MAAKHMSMWDTLALYLVLDDPAIVLKRELLRIPFYGWFLWKATAIAIDRGAGASACGDVDRGEAFWREGRPILIFPEGTRKKPGAMPDYKPGVAGLYGLLDVTCVPVALNSGRLLDRLSQTARNHRAGVPGAHPAGMKRRGLHGAAGAADRGCHKPAFTHATRKSRLESFPALELSEHRPY